MSGRVPRAHGADALSTSGGAALPFLPTLVTAIAVAAVSLFCHAPSTEQPVVPIATAQASSAGADGFHPALPGPQTAAAVPAALAFARQYPLTIPLLAGADETKVPAARPIRPAVAARRPCVAPRCGESRRIDTAARTAPAPTKATSDSAAIPEAMRGQGPADADLLPTGAIPFAATAASWVETARGFGGSVAGGATSLGGSAIDFLASAR